jgi:hypothetical protein
MEIQAKALDEEEFEAANSNEYVCASWTQHTSKQLKTCYLYIWLGRQVLYKKRGEKQDETKFKKFLGCVVEVYETLDDLDNGTLTNKDSGIDVILFY